MYFIQEETTYQNKRYHKKTHAIQLVNQYSGEDYSKFLLVFDHQNQRSNLTIPGGGEENGLLEFEN